MAVMAEQWRAVLREAVAGLLPAPSAA
jgi:hypothetical protein